MDRGCCHSQKYGCYHFMPAKHQFYVLREDKSVEAPGADTSTVAGRHFYSLAPLSPTSAYGFPMNGRLYCEINEISPHRVQIMVRNAAPEVRWRKSVENSLLINMPHFRPPPGQLGEEDMRRRPERTLNILLRSRRPFSTSVFIAGQTAN